jgi:diguanylate cyclase (GGDEF)-like protein
MGQQRVRARSTARTFATYAAITVAPVLILGLVLAATYRREARDRGLAEGRSEAMLVAHTAIEPLLDSSPLSRGLSAQETTSIERLTKQAVSRGDVLQLRLRTLDGHVAFADRAVDLGLPVDDEVLEAAEGHTVIKLTHLQFDRTEGPDGPAAVEVYLPISGGWPSVRVGVLEVYLPFAPIHDDVASGLHSLYRTLVAGLLLLWASLFGISVSITRHLRRQVALNRHNAEHDALTSLPNRELFRMRATRQLDAARGGGRAVAVAIIDLDRFKEVNDTLGHQSGDQVLIEIGARLAAAVGPGDTIARLGGDEFGVFLADGATASATLERLRETIREELVVDRLPLSIEASSGYAIAPDDGSDIATLLQRADVAMYVAKAVHGGVARYDALADHYDAADLALVGELRSAIQAGELVLHYQPKRPLDGGRVTTVEALVRWQHPTLGLLAPARFLPLAEQTDVIHDLTAWVLRQALEEIGPLDSVGVAVNVSARNLGARDFAHRVTDILTTAGFPADRLTVELTETAIVDDPARAIDVLADLAAAGVHVSIDDFGQGQTSLRYLSVLPVHELKIDRQFVSSMLRNPADRAIVRSIIDLGHNLGMHVVAEGVETEPVLDALRVFGCDVAQGFLIAHPMPAGALVAWLAEASVSL